jgi:hypothetical protein
MLSEEQKTEILAQEKLISEVIKIREKENPKKWWEKAGVVSAATAILTVLVTSVASYYSQKALRDNENRITSVRDATMLARDAARHANKAIAGVLKLNEERKLAITGAFASLDSTRVNAIMDSANRAQEDWRAQREDVEMELFLAFDSAAVMPRWREARASLDSQVSCIEHMYERVRSVRKYAANTTCHAESESSLQSVADFRGAVSAEYSRLLK